MKVGDIVRPNGSFKTSAEVNIENIRKAKVTEIYREPYGGAHGMEIEILEGNGTANECYRNDILQIKHTYSRSNNFRNPSRFSKGCKVRVFQRPFQVISEYNPVQDSTTPSFQHGYEPPDMNDILLIMSLT